MEKGSPSYLKAYNQKEICRCILENGAMTRAQLAKKLALSKPTTSLNVQGLIDHHLLMETTIATSYVGKKGTLLDFDTHAYFILIVDTTSSSLQQKISLYVCNLKGETIHQDVLMTSASDTSLPQEQMFAMYHNTLVTWIQNFTHPTGFIRHVVLSLPGTTHSQYQDFSLFNQELQVTCSISNDINLALLGEKKIQQVTKKNIAYLRINQGLGGAFSFQNQLYTGENFAAGEIGYYETLIEKEGKLQSIALRDLLSVHALLKEKELLNICFDSTLSPFEDFLLGIQKQDAWCRKKVQDIYVYLENLVINLVVTLDIDEIFIAGAILQLLPDATTRLQQKIATYPYASTKIKEASGNIATIQGGYLLAMEALMGHMLI